MVIHTDKYEEIVFMENQLKSQKKKKKKKLNDRWSSVYIKQFMCIKRLSA